jgi:hypothetical protein
MTERSIEEITKDLMKWPNAVSEQLSRHTQILADLIKFQERVIELICKLHDLDIEELRAILRSSEESAEAAE